LKHRDTLLDLRRSYITIAKVIEQRELGIGVSPANVLGIELNAERCAVTSWGTQGVLDGRNIAVPGKFKIRLGLLALRRMVILHTLFIYLVTPRLINFRLSDQVLPQILRLRLQEYRGTLPFPPGEPGVA
jgi:hypothetical protein